MRKRERNEREEEEEESVCMKCSEIEEKFSELETQTKVRERRRIIFNVV